MSVVGPRPLAGSVPATAAVRSARRERRSGLRRRRTRRRKSPRRRSTRPVCSLRTLPPGHGIRRHVEGGHRFRAVGGRDGEQIGRRAVGMKSPADVRRPGRQRRRPVRLIRREGGELCRLLSGSEQRSSRRRDHDRRALTPDRPTAGCCRSAAVARRHRCPRRSRSARNSGFPSCESAAVVPYGAGLAMPTPQ